MKKTAFLLLLVLVQVGWAQPQIKVFSLANRPAAATVEIVQALLQPGESVWPEERLQRLIVKAAPERLEQIRQLLEQIDVAAPQVWLTITQSASNPYSGGGFLQSYQGQQNVGASQQMLVMSGERATLTVGQDIPTVQPFWSYANGLGRVPAGVIFQRVGTGFSVEPTVVGNTIRLRLTPWMSYQSAQGPGRIDFSESATSVVLKDGDTTSISTSTLNQSQQNSALGLVLGWGQQQSSSTNQLWIHGEIRVEPPPIPADPPTPNP
jgi:hypothetical protein